MARPRSSGAAIPGTREDVPRAPETVRETKDVKAEFDRIAATGATVVKEPYDIQGMWIATFADPDGNYFQLMSPWEQGPAS